MLLFLFLFLFCCIPVEYMQCYCVVLSPSYACKFEMLKIQLGHQAGWQAVHNGNRNSSSSSRRARARNELSLLDFQLRQSASQAVSPRTIQGGGVCVRGCADRGPGERQPLIERRTQSTLNVAAGTQRQTNTICS